MNHKCPCCENRTLPGDDIFPGSFYICPVCFWEDDNVQYEDPDFAGGANKESLNEARLNYTAFGAVNEESVRCVRPPTPKEMRHD